MAVTVPSTQFHPSAPPPLPASLRSPFPSPRWTDYWPQKKIQPQRAMTGSEPLLSAGSSVSWESWSLAHSSSHSSQVTSNCHHLCKVLFYHHGLHQLPPASPRKWRHHEDQPPLLTHRQHTPSGLLRAVLLSLASPSPHALDITVGSSGSSRTCSAHEDISDLSSTVPFLLGFYS